MDPKELKRLAKACRDAGIKQFKNKDLEFTLTDDAPVSNYKKAQASVSQEEVATDMLSEEELLLWSVGGIPTEDKKAE